MKPGRKKLLAIVFISVMAVVIGTTTYFLFFHKTDDFMRVRHIPGAEILGFSHKDYSQSRLYIHASGTFEIELIEKDKTIFAGIGTYTKTRSQYIFAYTQNSGEPLVTKSYDIKKGRVHFEFEDVLYYFGR